MFKRTALCLISLALCTTALNAQTPSGNRTVLDGVYTEAQAERGRVAYTNGCGRCHGENLEGVAGPTLIGDRFIDRWREDTLDSIFNFMRTGMPPGRQSSAVNPASDGMYLDMVTYILKGNGYPAGATELTVPETSNVFLIHKDGPRPVPDGSLVMTVGCLSQAPTGQWILFNATEPTRNRNPNESSAAEMSTSKQKRPGALVFRLADLDAVPAFDPAAHKGHRLQAKGFIVRQPNAERINLSSLEVLDPTCGQ
jgi:S-disulfanyl-L-cysteine oxidoreductase SoxD